MELIAVIWKILAYGVLPAWLLAGLGDWFCHRRTSIETTSGPGESVFHILLYLQIALPVSLGLLLEINAAMLLLFGLAVLAHMATSLWDTAYSQPRRHIAPIEQQVHSWLEMLPLIALLLCALIHWQALTEPGWSLEWRREAPPRPWNFLLPLLLLLGLAPILEEWRRGRRARSRARDLKAPGDPSAAPRP